MANIKTTLKKTDLVERKPTSVMVNGKKIMFVMIDGTAYALEGACSHRGGPLEKGVLTDYSIACPWHGALYDVRTGVGDPRTPWGPKQQTYKVQIDENGEVWVDA